MQFVISGREVFGEDARFADGAHKIRIALTQLPQADLDTEERGIGYKTSEVPISKGGEVEDEAITRK